MSSMNQQNHPNNTYYSQNTSQPPYHNPSIPHNNTYQYNYQSNKPPPEMTQPLTHYANTNNTSSNTNKNYYTSKLRNTNNPNPTPYRILPPHTSNSRSNNTSVATSTSASATQSRFHYNNTNNNKPNTNTIPTTNSMNNPTQSLHTYPQTHTSYPYTSTPPNTQPTSLHSSSNYTPNTTTSTATTATHTTHTQPQSYTQQRATPYPVPYPHRAVVTTTQPYQPQTQHKTITAPQTRSAISKPPTTHNRTNTQPTQPTTQRYQYPPQYQHQTRPQTKPTVTTTAPQSQPTNTYPQPIITTTHPPTYQYPPPYQPPPNYPPTHPPPGYQYPPTSTPIHPLPSYPHYPHYAPPPTAPHPLPYSHGVRPPIYGHRAPHRGRGSHRASSIKSTSERYREWKNQSRAFAQRKPERDRHDKYNRGREYRGHRDKYRDRHRDHRDRSYDRNRIERDRRYRHRHRDHRSHRDYRDRDRDRHRRKRSRSYSRSRSDKSSNTNTNININKPSTDTITTQPSDTINTTAPITTVTTMISNTEQKASQSSTQQLLINTNDNDNDCNIAQNNKTDHNKAEINQEEHAIIEQKQKQKQKEKEKEIEEEKEEDPSAIHALLLASRDDNDISQSDNNNDAMDESEDDIDKKNIEQRRNVNYENFSQHCVSVKGENIPLPIELFSDCLGNDSDNINTQQLLCNLQHEHFIKPTPIQKHCLPILLTNCDIMACAQTGSGKTLAFLLPIIAQLLINDQVNRVFFAGKTACALPLALIMAPTRELTIQIDEQVYKMTRDTWIRSFAVFGGDNYEDQAREIEKFQVDILCATPGRLMDMVDGCKVSLEYIKHLAFDEADNMLDLGFKDKVQQLVHERGMPDKSQRQTVMFSATFPDPIQQLAKDFMKEFVFVKVSNLGSSPGPITQIVKWVEESQKRDTLIKDIAQTNGKIIVFCGRRQIADATCNYLKEKSISVGCLHGHMNQHSREETILKFKDDKFRILCATSVAARGLDFPSIEKVINFDMPVSVQNYTHRIGRTGRIGSNGIAISYFNRTSRSMAGPLTQYLKTNNQQIPRWLNEMSWKR